MSKAEKDFKGTGGLMIQWVGLLAGPVAWLLQLQVAYVLIPWACAHDQEGISLHMVTIIFLLVAAGGAFISWRVWQQAGQEWPGGAGGIVPRSRFMAVLGLFTSAFFFLIILIQGVASFILHPCQS